MVQKTPEITTSILIDPGNVDIGSHEYELSISQGDVDDGGITKYSLSTLAEGSPVEGYNGGWFDGSRDAVVELTDAVSKYPDMDTTAGNIMKDRNMLPGAETVEEISTQTEVTATTEKARKLMQEITGASAYDSAVESIIKSFVRDVETPTDYLEEMESEHGVEQVQITIEYEAERRSETLEPSTNIRIDCGPGMEDKQYTLDELTAFRKPDAVETAFLLGQRAHEYAV